MTNYTRREFLKRVALGIGLAALVPYQLSRSQHELNRNQPVGAVPAETVIPLTVFWEGRVSDLFSNAITIYGSGFVWDGIKQVFLEGGRQTEFNIQVDSDTRIWKGRHVDLSAVEKEDVVYGRGLIMFDGSILAQRLWVNIAQYRGKVSKIRRGMFLLELVGNRQAHIPVLFDVETVINDGQGSQEDISVGRYIQVLGVMQKDGKLKATRIWA